MRAEFSAPGQPGVSVVICTHNRPVLLERCLQAVGQLDYPAFTVTVVDNAPRTDEARAVAARYGADYLLAPIKGVSRARNAGARSARNDVVAYLDDDTIPHADWLKCLVAEFDDPAVMAVTGPNIPLAARDASPAARQTALSASAWGAKRFQVDRRSPEWFERANFGGVGDGNMAFRREILQTLAGFDERLGRGMAISGDEEHYAYFLLIEAGHRVAYAPQAIVFEAVRPATRERKLRLISETSAYAAFLVRRHPRLAWRVIRFFAEGWGGKRRTWRMPPRPQPPVLSTSETTRAVLSGLCTGWCAVRQPVALSDQAPVPDAPDIRQG